VNVLVLLAHHDDEYFVSARIRREIRDGNRLLVAYTTWGSAYGASADVREAESFRALSMLGVSSDDVVLLGRELGVADGNARADCVRILARCREVFGGSAIDRVITVAWEGGHPDHDITHLIAKRLATDWQALEELYEFALYTAAGAPSPFFRVNRFSARATDADHTHLGLRERMSALLLVRCYRSQWRSFLGLLPEAAVRFLVLGRQELRRVAPKATANEDAPKRPHNGTLFYERRFNTSFESLMADAAPLLDTPSPA